MGLHLPAPYLPQPTCLPPPTFILGPWIPAHTSSGHSLRIQIGSGFRISKSYNQQILPSSHATGSNLPSTTFYGFCSHTGRAYSHLVWAYHHSCYAPATEGTACMTLATLVTHTTANTI